MNPQLQDNRVLIVAIGIIVLLILMALARSFTYRLTTQIAPSAISTNVTVNATGTNVTGNKMNLAHAAVVIKDASLAKYNGQKYLDIFKSAYFIEASPSPTASPTAAGPPTSLPAGSIIMDNVPDWGDPWVSSSSNSAYGQNYLTTSATLTNYSWTHDKQLTAGSYYLFASWPGSAQLPNQPPSYVVFDGTQIVQSGMPSSDIWYKGFTGSNGSVLWHQVLSSPVTISGNASVTIQLNTTGELVTADAVALVPASEIGGAVLVSPSQIPSPSLSTSVDVKAPSSSNNKVNVGQTLQMTATVLPSDATNKSITWSIREGDGATINASTGLLTGVKTGTVLVRATTNDGSSKYGTKQITVTTASTPSTPTTNGLVIAGQDSINTIGNDTLQMIATLYPENINVTNDVTWSIVGGYSIISSTGVLSVSGLSLQTVCPPPPQHCITPVYYTTVKATYKDGRVATEKITIRERAAELTLSPAGRPASYKGWRSNNDTSINITKSLQLRPHDWSRFVINTPFIWDITNVSGEATIDQNGLLTGIKPGRVDVKIVPKENPNFFDNLTVMVTIPNSTQVTSVSAALVYPDTPIMVGTSIYWFFATNIPGNTNNYIKASVLPKTALQPAYGVYATVESGDAIKEDEGGNLIAVKPGTATVKVTASDGSAVYGTVQVTVMGQPTPGVCQDSDELNFAVRGTITSGSAIYKDWCDDAAHLVEYYCDAGNNVQHTYWDCPGTVSEGGCFNGACQPTSYYINILSPKYGEKFYTYWRSAYRESLDVDIPVEWETNLLDSAPISVQLVCDTRTIVGTLDKFKKLGTYTFPTFPNISGSPCNIEVLYYGYNHWPLAADRSDAIGISTSMYVKSIVIAPSDPSAGVREGDSVQMVATVLPSGATQMVNWSVTNGTGQAVIDSLTGLLQTIKAGTVTVTATAVDGSGVSGTYQIAIAP